MESVRRSAGVGRTAQSASRLGMMTALTARGLIAKPNGPRGEKCQATVIGMVKGAAAERFWRKMPGERLAPAEREVTISGVFLETDDATGLARRIEPLRQGGQLSAAFPEAGAASG
jgi:hypothetical protein